MTFSLVKLEHFRSNALDPAAEEEFDVWTDFVDALVADGHEHRGVEGEPEDDYKLGFRGATRPTVAFPVTVAWDLPLGDDDADWRFRDRYGDETELRRRCNAVVSGSSAWVWLDIDTQTVDEWDQLRATLIEERLDAVAYSSYSHGRDPKLVKIRLVIRASRAYSVEEIRRVRRGSGPYLGTTIDRACLDPARIFFLPACPEWRAEQAFFWRNDGGEALDVDDVLRLTPESELEAAKRLEMRLGVWDGRIATDADFERALGEVDRWCAGIGAQAGGNFRAFTEQGTFKFGSYIGAGALDLDGTRARLEEGYHRARALHGDDQPIAYRLRQIDIGLTQGARRPRLPFTPEQEAEIERAVDRAAYEVLWAQLESQRPPEEVPLDEARARSEAFLAQDVYDYLHVDASTVGAGKSFLLAKVAAQRARRGLLTVIQTQEHAVAAQTRAELHRQGGPEVRSVHLYSSASPPPNAPDDHRCPRMRDEPDLVETLHDYALPLRKVCATACDRAETCPALAAAKDRSQALQRAQVVFVSQAGVGQVRDWLEDGAVLLTDEQPEPLHQTSLPPQAVQELLDLDRVPGMDVLWSDRVQALLRAALAGEPLDEEETAEDYPVSVERVRALGREERKLFRNAVHFYRLAQRRLVRKTPGGGVEGFETTPAHDAMLNARQSVLVDATPLLAALPGTSKVHRQHVADPPGVHIDRRMVYRRQAGSSALYSTDWVNERVVLGAVKRALETHPGEILLVTFKTVREWLERRPELRGRIQLAHFGAVRGKNAWKDVDVVYTLGTPRFDRERMLQSLLGRENVQQEWTYLAAAELEQAMGRARHVSRTKDLVMVCEGSLAPLGWHSGNCRIVDRIED